MYQPWFWPLIQICVIALILQIIVMYYDLNKKNIVSYKKFKEYVEVSIKIQHINFIAGQYMIFKFNIDNKVMLRAFSFSNNVEKDGYARFVIKRVSKGIVSNYINNNIKNIKNIDVSGPFGEFFINKEVKNHILIAAGSGITPIQSILETHLKNKENKFLLIYGNKTSDDIIFDKELSVLLKSYDNLRIISLTNDGTKKYLKSQKGILDKLTIKQLVSKENLYNTSFYVCGPSIVVENAISVLKEFNIEEKDINVEKFNLEKNDTHLSKKYLLTIENDEKEITVEIDSSKTILQSCLDNNIDMHYSCMNGICKTCIVYTKDNVNVLNNMNVLSQEEKEKGAILPCCSFPVKNLRIKK